MSEKENKFKGLYLVSNNESTNVVPIVDKRLDKTSLEVIQTLLKKSNPSLQDHINDFVSRGENKGFGTPEEQKQTDHLREAIEKFKSDNEERED